MHNAEINLFYVIYINLEPAYNYHISFVLIWFILLQSCIKDLARELVIIQYSHHSIII